MSATPEPTGTAALAELCTSAVDWQRHRAGRLVIPPGNAFLGLLGRRGTTACGLAEAIDQPELDLLSAQWQVPRANHAHIERLPSCPACFPPATRTTTARDDAQQYIARCLGPRRIGGRYYRHQMHDEVTVLAIDRNPDGWMTWSITEATDQERAAGTSRTHCTGWDDAKDRVIAQPAPAPAIS